MKKLVLIIASGAASLMNAQVIFGDAVGTATAKSSVLLEFSKADSRGLVLPYLTTMPAAAVPGSLALDATTATNPKIKYLKGGSPNTWVDLSGGAAAANLTTALAVQNGVEKTNAKTIIGAAGSTADGVLVLESTTKAMVLPTVKSTDDIKDPAPGMIVYVDGSRKLLAVFNGAQWSYWE